MPRARRAAERVARGCLQRGDPCGTLLACERGLTVDVLNERLTRVAMEAEAELGLRLAVARRYETLRDRLAARLGLEPERATRTLYRTLLAQA